jgi:threonine synthase
LAQAENANPLYQAYKEGWDSFKAMTPKKTLASAIQIGDPVSVEKAIKTLKEFDGIVEQASEDELANAAALADKTGMYCCPHTGVALAVLTKLVEKQEISKTDRTIVISTAHGLKFSEFKVGYHEKTLSDVNCAYANKPIIMEPDVDAVKAILMEEFKKNQL